MAINQIASVAGSQASQALESGKQKFGKTLEQVSKSAAPDKQPTQKTAAPSARPNVQSAGPVNRVQSPARMAGVTKAAAPQKVDGARGVNLEKAGKVLDQVSAAQARMDKVLALAQSGRSFTPAELLALQAQVSNASQELDLAGKVVEKATGGVKQILQTQV